MSDLLVVGRQALYHWALADEYGRFYTTSAGIRSGAEDEEAVNSRWV